MPHVYPTHPRYHSAYNMDFIGLLLLASVLAFVPTLVYALLIWWLDRYEKEPVPLLLVAFIWGALPAIGLAFVLEMATDIPLQQIMLPSQAEMAGAGLLAPLIEEAAKAVILVVLLLAYRREFDNVLDGVIYGAMVGLGFAFVENVLYFLNAGEDGKLPTVEQMLTLWVFRAGVFGLNHSMFTAFTGAALGYVRSLKKGWQRGLLPALGLGTAMIFHAVHNSLLGVFGLLSGDENRSGLLLGACFGALLSDYLGLILVLVLAIVSSIREGHIIRETLWEEVALGRFTPDEYNTLMSGARRWSIRWNVLFSGGYKRWRQIGRFFDLATELAFRKHRMNDGDIIHQTISARDIARLRQEIDSLKLAMVKAF